MHISRQYKMMFPSPFHHSLCFRCPSIGCVTQISKLIRKIPIQINPISIVALSQFKPIRIHGRHNKDSGIINEIGSLRITTISFHQPFNKIQREFPTHRFISVHIGNIFKLWLNFIYTGII